MGDVDGDAPGTISLQHVLVQGDSGLKHWRQDWQWEPTSQYDFKGDALWVSRDLTTAESVGAWVQKVTQVDDSPRYQCTAAWVMRGPRPYWECQAWSPLPRREFTQRSDYNVLDRRNRHWITAAGWLHEQDNRKLIVNAEGIREVAQEKGMDSYTRVADERCAPARAWWAAHREAWRAVQGVWAHVYGHHPRLQMRPRVEGHLLWERLFELTDTYVAAGLADWAALAEQAYAVIGSHVVHESSYTSPASELPKVLVGGDRDAAQPYAKGHGPEPARGLHHQRRMSAIQILWIRRKRHRGPEPAYCTFLLDAP